MHNSWCVVYVDTSKLFRNMRQQTTSDPQGNIYLTALRVLLLVTESPSASAVAFQKVFILGTVSIFSVRFTETNHSFSPRWEDSLNLHCLDFSISTFADENGVFSSSLTFYKVNPVSRSSASFEILISYVSIYYISIQLKRRQKQIISYLAPYSYI